jgi:Domain of unknown function (DUF3291)
MQIAQMNVGTALYETNDPRMADFMNNLDRVNALADVSPGFVWRLTGEGNNATDIRPVEDPLFLVNMSVWASVAALFDFVYRSDHRSLMVRRREWFAKPDGPYHVGAGGAHSDGGGGARAAPPSCRSRADAARLHLQDGVSGNRERADRP